MRGISDRYHDRVASIYDSIYDGDPYWKFYRELTWNNLKRYLPREHGARILDAGGGTGYWALKLARSGFHVTLTDTSRGMLDVAQEKICRAGLEDNVGVVSSDISGLAEMDDGAFDLALAQGDPLSFCRDAEAGVRALFRVLRPGGICVASVDGKLGQLDSYLERNDLDELEKFARSGRTVWLAKDRKECFPIRTFTPRELRGMFTGAGFEMLSLIGKTVLPVRRLRERLRDRDTYVRLLHLETRLHAEEAMLGRASHLEVAARRPACTARGMTGKAVRYDPGR